MKLYTTKDSTEKFGQLDERECQVAINEVTFEALTTNLYTDIPMAVVRELSTNASDAHVDVQKRNEPFDVQLPNDLSPTFKVRDYGPGLSYDGVNTTYTFFASDRRESNEHNGVWGLGALAPLSYVNSFSVTSFYKGHRYEYTILRENNVCKIVLINGRREEGELIVPTSDEPSGLEISIPVKVVDYSRFSTAAEKVYQYFDVYPNITGANVTLDEHEPIIEGDGYQLFDKKIGPTPILVVMGQVCYAVKSEEVNCKIKYGSSIRLFVENGSCSFNLGREELHYNERTIKTIQAAVDAAGTDAEAKIIESLKSLSTAIGKAVAVARYRRVLDRLDLGELSRVSLYEADVYRLKSCHLQQSYNTRPERLIIQTYSGSYFVPQGYKDYIFLENDVAELTQKWKMRLKYYLQQRDSTREIYYLVEIEDLAKVEEVFGLMVTKVSELPAVPRKPRSYATGPTGARQYISLFEPTSQLQSSWSSIKSVTKEDGCSIPRKGYRPIWRGKEVEPNQLYGIAEMIGFKNTYGIAPKSYDRLRGEHGLPDLEAAAKEYIEKYAKNAGDLELSVLLGDNPYRYSSIHHTLLKRLKGLSTECDNMILAETPIPNAPQKRKLMREFGLVPKALSNNDSLEAFYEKYPLIKLIGNYYDNIKETEANIIKYIKLIEGN